MSFLLRLFSYAFHLLLTLFFLGVSLLAAISGRHNLSFRMLPWKGEPLTWWLLGLSLAGLASVLLAATGRFRHLFPLWCLFVAGLMIWGMFLSRAYAFPSPAAFQFGVAITAGALIALLGGLTLWRAETPKKRNY